MEAVIKCLAVTLFTLIMMQKHTHAYTIPEKLEYELTWAGVKIGTSSISTQYIDNDLVITSKVDSAKWTAPFYKVDDLEFSKLKRVGNGFALHHYNMKLHEGKNQWHRAVTLDRKTKKIRFYNLLTFDKAAGDLVEPVWDPVSCLYYLRYQPLSFGKAVYVDLIGKSRPSRIKVKVLRKEIVTTPAGTFRTVVISPEMTIDSEGLFYARGALHIWLTDDEKRVPVMIEKRIEDLFRQGVPDYLKPMIPASAWSNTPNIETIRAVLVGGRW